jgi:hypothetical protein
LVTARAAAHRFDDCRKIERRLNGLEGRLGAAWPAAETLAAAWSKQGGTNAVAGRIRRVICSPRRPRYLGLPDERSNSRYTKTMKQEAFMEIRLPSPFPGPVSGSISAYLTFRIQ